MCHSRPGSIQSSAGELSPRSAKEGRAFLSAPYVLRENGRYRCAGRPSQCPKAEPGQSCRIKRQGQRTRKTGPAFALDVMLCHTHGGSFTVYPPGYGPYDRESMAPLGPSGEPLQEAASQSEQASEPLQETASDSKRKEQLELWRGTTFRRGPRRCRGPSVVARADRG